MKKIFIILCIVSLYITADAQTQQGYVKTRGRLSNNGAVIKGNRLPGTTILVKGRSAVTSQNNGVFSFPVTSQQYYLQNVIKQGYTLSDPDILSRQYSFTKNPLVIVLDSTGLHDDDRLVAEKKIRQTLRRQLQEKEDEIEMLKEQNKLTEAQYREQMQKLYSDQKSNELLISEMAERYAKIDYDQIDEFNRQIAEFILNGELTKADSLLNTKGDISKRSKDLKSLIEHNAQEEAEIKERSKKLEERKELVRNEMTDLAQDCYNKFEIFKMRHINDSAAYYISLRSSLDPTNLEWPADEAHFASDYLADYAKALSIFESLLKNIIQKEGEKSIEAITQYSNIGIAFWHLGKYEEAENNHLKAIELSRGLLGDNHPLMASCLNNLSVIYMDLNKFDESQRCLEQSLAITPNSLADSVRCYLNLGANYIYAGQLPIAMSYHEKALELIQSEEKINPSWEATCYNGMATILSNEDHFSEALSYYEKALELNLNKFGKEHPDVAVNYANIGHTYITLGKYPEALDFLLKSLDIDTLVYGKWHPTTAITYSNIGHSYNKLGDYEKAQEYYQNALDIDMQFYGENHQRVAHDLAHCARKYIITKEYPKALDLLFKSLNITKELLGDNHPDVSDLYNNIGDVYTEMGDYPKAIEYLEKALKLDMATYGDKHTRLATVYNNLGNVYNKMEDYDKSAMYIEKTLPILIGAYGEEHPNVAITYYNASVLYKKQGNYPKSLELAEKAYQILSKLLPEGHPTLKTVQNGIDEVKSKM
jgi:tetratricopeptide (TPR) repeat protein